MQRLTSFSWCMDNRDRHWAKHGICFQDATKIFLREGLHYVRESFKGGEKRQEAFGLIDGRLYQTVFVWREKARHFITFRRASEDEVVEYLRALKSRQ